MTDDTLRRLELDMLAESTRAAARVVVAVDRMRTADAALRAVAGVSWGPVVAEWHEARDELSEALEAFAAWQEFTPERWWA